LGDIENLLLGHPNVTVVVVVGIPDQKWASSSPCSFVASMIKVSMNRVCTAITAPTYRHRKQRVSGVELIHFY